MKLIPFDKNKLGVRSYSTTSNLGILESFAESGLECAQLDGWTQTNASIAAASLNASIKRFNKGGFRAVSRKGEVYLIRTDR